LKPGRDLDNAPRFNFSFMEGVIGKKQAIDLNMGIF
jgi:hypothetical protein